MYIVSLRLHAAAARLRRRAAAMSTAAALRSPLQMWQQRFWSVPFHVWRFWSIGTDSARDPVVSCPYQQQPPRLLPPPLLMLPPACLPQPACFPQPACPSSAVGQRRTTREQMHEKHRQERKLIFVGAHTGTLAYVSRAKWDTFWRVPNS